MRRFLGCLCALLLSVSPHAELRIGVTVEPVRQLHFLPVKAMQDRAKAGSRGVTLQVEDSASDVVRQLSQVESFISQKVDAIIVAQRTPQPPARSARRSSPPVSPSCTCNSRPEVDNLPPAGCSSADESPDGKPLRCSTWPRKWAAKATWR